MKTFTPEVYKNQAGPQSASDTAFAKDMRLLQSCWRAWMGFPYGEDHTGELRGSFLAEGLAKPHNFLSEACFAYAQHRVKNKAAETETWDANRLFCNMLSSQTMCLNLFYPLYELWVSQSPQLPSLLEAAFGMKLSRVTEFRIEKALRDSPIRDKTGLDVLIAGTDSQETPILYAIEVKYTEPLGSNPASALGLQLALAGKYGMLRPEASFNGKTYWQIFRNHLLARSLAEKDGHSNIYQLVVAPQAHPTTKKEIASMRAILQDEILDRIKYVPIERAVAALIKVSGTALSPYYASFSVRYLPQ
jgi:hypothetical protein